MKYAVPLPKETKENRMKLNYLNDRIGQEFSLMDCVSYKVVLSIKEFLIFNQIEKLETLTDRQIEILDRYYIGFLSVNNNCITFRCIIKNTKLERYFKVLLNPRNLNKFNFYSKPSSFNILYTNTVDVHIAEGIFDILSIDRNVCDYTKYPNSYFYASCGFGYISVIRFLLSIGMNTGIHLHIYSDNDKTDWNHQNYLMKNSSVGDWMDEIYIHRNQFPGEKDYGVPRSNIEDSFRKLKSQTL